MDDSKNQAGNARLLNMPGRRDQMLRTMLLCALTAAIFFLPFYIIDGGFFHYAGDFNSQQISFYRYMNGFIKGAGYPDGMAGAARSTFSWATDLGSGAMNAYSFYLYGSPFFWLSLIFPQNWLPYLMVPLLVLKFAVAGGGAYRYLCRYVRRSDHAVLGACLYAFSGFSIYNVFFNHFIDVVALFPWMLWALDETLYEQEKHYGLFAFWVGVNLLNNYFFFIGQVIFLVIYFICKLTAGDFPMNLRLFARLAFESLLGAALGFVLLWPAVLSLLQNPRTIDLSSGWGFLTYSKVQQYLAILLSWILPPDSPYITSIWSEGIIKWTSMSAYLPLCSLAGAMAYWRARKGDSKKRIVATCAIFALVPVLNSAFYALNSSYYARWYYMPVLVLCGATASLLARPHLARRELPRAWGLTLAVTLSAAAFGLVPYTDDDGVTTLGVTEEPARFWAILGVSVLGLAIFGVLWHFFRDRQRWPTVMLAAVLVFSFVYGSVHLSLTKYAQWDTDSDLIAETYDSVQEVKEALPDDAFYRIDAYGAHNNLGLWFDKSCLQFFNSTVAPSIMEFYPEVGVKRDVNSKPEVQNYALRGLLSVRYTLVAKDADSNWQGEDMNGWDLVGSTSAYQIYENKNWVPMGFAQQYYVTADQLDQVDEDSRAQVLLRAVLLDEDQIAAYGDLLQPIPDDGLTNCTQDTYAEDCTACRAEAVENFTATRTGFTAETDYDTDRLVFFSVPYDDGFTAAINGEPAKIEKVDNGLMALRVPAGQTSITCTYHTPGLRTGTIISLAALAVYGAYLVVLKKRKCL